MHLKPSQFNIFIPMKHGQQLAYNSFSRALSVLEPDDLVSYDKINNLDYQTAGENPTVDGLLNCGFVVPEEVDELALVQEYYQSVRYSSQTVTMTICPTLACNFGCDYCFQGLDKSNEKMSPAVQDGIVQYYEDVSDSFQSLHLAWYGGEPLIRLEVIKQLSDRLLTVAARKGKGVIASMVTNGFFLTREVAQELHQRQLSQVQITLDGTKAYHDQRRHLHSKKGTFDTIIGNLQSWIDEVPIAVNIRVNIDERNQHDIHNLIDYMAEAGLGHKNNLKMYFAPVESMTVGCHSIADITMHKSMYGQLETDLHRYAFERGLAHLPYPPRFLGLCAAVKPYDIIAVPNGDVHKCWDTVSFPFRRVGDIFTIKTAMQNKAEPVEAWNLFSPFNNEACRHCKLLPNCSGSCAFKFVHPEDMIGDASLPCPSWKYSINEKLILKAEAEGVINQDDYDPETIRTRPELLCDDVYYHQAQEAQPASIVLPILSA